MKSFTGNCSSVRGWALLLALLLGAGLVISACGEEEVPAPTTPTPAPPPPAPAPEPEPTGPATPGNLTVSATTSNSITWTWDAVDGVIGYEGRFSLDGSFTDVPTPIFILAPLTSHTVSNLSGNMTGHFRVRSGVGASLNDLTYSEWSEGVSGTTAAPPAAVALPAPTGLQRRSADDNSITIEWDAVDDAASYEVQQQADGADAWSAASCGGAGNVVDEAECEATDLDEGTAYNFRVRAVPAASDTANAASDWTETSSSFSTTGISATPIASGAMGALNVRWSSDDTSITWSWDRIPGATYDFYLDTTGTYDDSPNPCSFPATGTEDSAVTSTERTGLTHNNTTIPNNVSLLCVRTNNPTNTEENLSFAWAATSPVTPGLATTPETAKDMVTTALSWGEVPLAGGFDYEARVVADPQRDNRVKAEVTLSDMQRRCEDSDDVVLFGNADVNVTLDEVVVERSHLTPYHGYSLCMRFANAAGSSEWFVSGATDVAGSTPVENYTRPARPPTPRIVSSRTETGETHATIAWSVAVRDKSTNVPRSADGFRFKTITYYPYWRDDTITDGTSRRKTRTRPTVADCDLANQALTRAGDDLGVTEIFDADTDNSFATNPEGIVITRRQLARSTAPTGEAALDPTDAGYDPWVNGFTLYSCIQAQDGPSGSRRFGPWVLGETYTVRHLEPSS